MSIRIVFDRDPCRVINVHRDPRRTNDGELGKCTVLIGDVELRFKDDRDAMALSAEIHATFVRTPWQIRQLHPSFSVSFLPERRDQ